MVPIPDMDTCWQSGTCWENLTGAYVVPAPNGGAWMSAKYKLPSMAETSFQGVDDGLEYCDDTTWIPPKFDGNLTRVDYMNDDNALIYFSCRYASDFNGKFTSGHSWWYRTGQTTVVDGKEMKGARPGFIGQLPDLPVGIEYWRPRLASEPVAEAETTNMTDLVAYFEREALSVRHPRCQPWCRYLIGLPCREHLPCQDCDFCLESEACEADCHDSGNNSIYHNPWRCLSSSCSDCKHCKIPTNRPCPLWRIFDYNCVLYIEDLNWWRIIPTSVARSNKTGRVIYPMPYGEMCPHCLREQTKFKSELGDYREGGCDNIPSVRPDYFKIPSWSDVGPHFECPDAVDDSHTRHTNRYPPFNCLPSDNPTWYHPPGGTEQEVPAAAKMHYRHVFPDGHEQIFVASDRQGTPVSERTRSPPSQVPLLTRILGGAAVLLCVSAVCSGPFRSIRRSSGYEAVAEASAGQAPFLDPEGGPSMKASEARKMLRCDARE